MEVCWGEKKEEEGSSQPPSLEEESRNQKLHVRKKKEKGAEWSPFFKLINTFQGSLHSTIRRGGGGGGAIVSYLGFCCWSRKEGRKEKDGNAVFFAMLYRAKPFFFALNRTNGLFSYFPGSPPIILWLINLLLLLLNTQRMITGELSFLSAFTRTLFGASAETKGMLDKKPDPFKSSTF